MTEFQARGVLDCFDRDGKLSVFCAVTGFSVDLVRRFIDGKKISEKDRVAIFESVKSQYVSGGVK